MERTKQWYVVYTKTGQEQKVCEALRRKKLESFYPVNKMVKASSGRESVSFKPLLERFVFVCLAKEEVDIVKNNNNINGIISLVHWLAEPVIVNQDDIFLLKRFFKMHDDIHLEKIKVAPSEPATISTQFSAEDTELITFHFPALGYTLTAQENRTRVRIITIPDHQTKTNVTKQYAEAR